MAEINSLRDYARWMAEQMGQEAYRRPGRTR